MIESSKLKTMGQTALLRAFGFWKIPVLSYVSPSVVELTPDVCKIKIPLNRKTKNHLNSMYFAVLAAGADSAAGLLAMQTLLKLGKTKGLAFKAMKANFYKRAEGDTIFVCKQGPEILKALEVAKATKERQNLDVKVHAFVPDKLGDEVVADFVMTLSLKV